MEGSNPTLDTQQARPEDDMMNADAVATLTRDAPGLARAAGGRVDRALLNRTLARNAVAAACSCAFTISCSSGAKRCST